MTCRRCLSKFLLEHNRLFWIELIVEIIGGLSYVYYFICTYIPKLFPSLDYIDFIVCALFILEHIMNMVIAHHRCKYMISKTSLLNFATEIIPLCWPLASNRQFNYVYRLINITRVLRVLRTYRILELNQSGEKQTTKQIIKLISTLLMMCLVSGGIVQILEMEYIHKELKTTFGTFPVALLNLQKHYHHYIYYALITISTVGYGEIMPHTILGQFAGITLTVLVLVIIPPQISELIDLVKSINYYSTRIYRVPKDYIHIILLGEINLESLISFCEEFFHEDHGTQKKNVVIVNNELPSPQMELFLSSQEGRNITYIQGNPMNDQDLIRADILNSQACIIFTNKHSNNPFEEDHRSILYGLYAKKFVYNASKEQGMCVNYFKKPFRLCMQLNSPDSPQNFYTALQPNYRRRMSQDQILVIEGMKMNILSKSCLTPGLVALLSNLLVSSGNEGNEDSPEWIKEYFEGRGHEIYRVVIKGNYLAKSFGEIALEIYEKYQAIPIALDISFEGRNILKLNPQTKESIEEILKRGLDNAMNMTATSKANKFRLTKRVPKAAIYIICPGKEICESIVNSDLLYRDNSNENEPLNNENTINDNNDNSDSDSKQEGGIVIYKIKPSQHSLKKQESSIISDTIETNNNNNNNEHHTHHNHIEKDYSSDKEDDYNNFHRIVNQTGNNNNYYETNEIIHQSIKDRDDINNHVVICGIHPELVQFILPLRAKYLPEKYLKWIVIVAPHLPQELNDFLSMFSKIIFIQGSPLREENLFRANITTAEIAVIMPCNPIENIENKQSQEDTRQLIDAQTISMYKTIKKINKKIKILTELVVFSNIEFLAKGWDMNDMNVNITSTNEQSSLSYEHFPPFAAGEVFLPSVVDKLTCQTFYNPNLLNILNLLLMGEKKKDKTDKILEQFFYFKGTNLFLIPCEIKNESYIDMYNRLVLKHKVIPIALFRKNHLGNFNYVYTNPKKTTLLRESDKIFILSSTNEYLALIDRIKNMNWSSSKYNGSGKENKKWEGNMNKKGQMSLFQVIEGQINEIKEGEEGNEGGSSQRGDERNFDFLQNRKTIIRKNEGSKYSEINRLQRKLDNGLNKLKYAKKKCEEIGENIRKSVNDEINNEFMMYIKTN